jgi:hypothetical protein
MGCICAKKDDDMIVLELDDINGQEYMRKYTINSRRERLSHVNKTNEIDEGYDNCNKTSYATDTHNTRNKSISDLLN